MPKRLRETPQTTAPLRGYRIMAITSPCHGEDTGSIPVTRSRILLKQNQN